MDLLFPFFDDCFIDKKVTLQLDAGIRSTIETGQQNSGTFAGFEK